MKAIDITGQKFGRLTAIKKNGFDVSPSRKHIKWDCLCDCGNFTNTRVNALKSGGTISCGCAVVGNVKHGLSKTSEYLVWNNIKARCNNPKNTEYKNYGERGIKVCSDWESSFDNFYRDMGQKPSQKHSIDRIDNSLGYSKENCRWADAKTQSRNKRNNRFYTFNGMTMCITDWASYLGVSFSTLHERIQNHSIEYSLSKFKEN